MLYLIRTIIQGIDELSLYSTHAIKQKIKLGVRLRVRVRVQVRVQVRVRVQ